MSKKRKGQAEPPPAAPPSPAPSAIVSSEPAPVAAPASEMTRRDFLATAGIGVAAVCGAGAVVGAVRFAIPQTSAGASARFPLGTPADFKARTVTWLRERELFVLRDEKGFGAFSSRCTHLGCTVRRTSDGFTCPCHGAHYDPLGHVLSGPARRELPWFQLWQEPDGRIWIDLGKTVQTGTAPLGEPSKDKA